MLALLSFGNFTIHLIGVNTIIFSTIDYLEVKSGIVLVLRVNMGHIETLSAIDRVVNYHWRCDSYQLTNSSCLFLRELSLVVGHILFVLNVTLLQ